ncbi:MAG TPA: hypothetical protein VHO25_09175 [Polyangiaceae bacterium]|nr:hypothetical protein [Polyangiaceae bacterium]
MNAPVAVNPFAKDLVGLKGWRFQFWRITKLDKGCERHDLVGSCLINAEHHFQASKKACARLHCERGELTSLGAGPPCQHERTKRTGCRYARKCNSSRCRHVDTCEDCGAERRDGKWDE